MDVLGQLRAQGLTQEQIGALLQGNDQSPGRDDRGDEDNDDDHEGGAPIDESLRQVPRTPADKRTAPTMDSDDDRDVARMVAVASDYRSVSSAPKHSAPASYTQTWASPFEEPSNNPDATMRSPGATEVGSGSPQSHAAWSPERSFQQVSGDREWRASNAEPEGADSGQEDEWRSEHRFEDDEEGEREEEDEEMVGDEVRSVPDTTTSRLTDLRITQDRWGERIDVQTQLEDLDIGDQPHQNVAFEEDPLPFAGDGGEEGFLEARTTRKRGRDDDDAPPSGEEEHDDSEGEHSDPEASDADSEYRQESSGEDDDGSGASVNSEEDGSDVFVKTEKPSGEGLNLGPTEMIESMREVLLQTRVEIDTASLSTDVRNAFEAMADNSEKCAGLLEQLNESMMELREAVSEEHRKYKDLIAVTCATMLAVVYKREDLPDLFEKADTILTTFLEERGTSSVHRSNTRAGSAGSKRGKKRRQ